MHEQTLTISCRRYSCNAKITIETVVDSDGSTNYFNVANGWALIKSVGRMANVFQEDYYVFCPDCAVERRAEVGREIERCSSHLN